MPQNYYGQTPTTTVQNSNGSTTQFFAPTVNGAPAGSSQSQQNAAASAPSTSSNPPPTDGGAQNTNFAPTPGSVVPNQTGGGVPPISAAAPGGDSAYSVAKQDITPQTEDQIYAYYAGKSAASIGAAIETEQAAEEAANVASTKETSARNFDLNARGMAGSSEAEQAAATTEKTRTDAINTAMAQRDTTLGQIYDNVTKMAATDFQYQQSTIAPQYIAQAEKNLTDTLTGIASKGMTLQELQQTNPNVYNTLLQYTNGDQNILNAKWLSVASPQVVGTPTQSGTNLVYAVQDPITKKISTVTLDTGVPLTADDIATNVAGVGVVVTNKLTGEAHVVGGTANPYYLANQQATLETKQQRLENSKALEATKIVGTQINNDARVQNFLGIAPYMAKLQAAQSEIATNGINETNAAELIDSATKINTGGQAITQGQTGLIQESQSYADQLVALQQKVKGQGGVIDPKIAKDITDLSSRIFQLYQGQYQQAVSQYSSRLKNVNGQDLSQYNPLTDITNLQSVTDGSYQSGLEDTLNTPVSGDTNIITTSDGSQIDTSL